MSVTLYHHTSYEGLKGIVSDGKILESDVDGVDAKFGQGVYLTSLGPEKSEEEVAKNNFDGAAAAMLEEGRGKIILEVTVPEKNVEKAPSGRDIYIHLGDIPTSAIKAIYRRNKKGKAIKCKTKKK